MELTYHRGHKLMKKEVLTCDLKENGTSKACDGPNASTIHLSGAGFMDAAGDMDTEALSFEICPDHAVQVLRWLLTELQNTNPKLVEHFLNDKFAVGRRPNWSR